MIPRIHDDTKNLPVVAKDHKKHNHLAKLPLLINPHHQRHETLLQLSLLHVASKASHRTNEVLAEHDVLFLRQQGIRYPKWHLTSPLRPSKTVKLAYGASIPASDLIGRCLLDVTKDSKGNRVVLHEPSLASYIINSPRIATPIYPQDAATIVSLLDIHPTRPGEDDDDASSRQKEAEEQDLDIIDFASSFWAGEPPPVPFEIFEAGTGMGSLTLHLARAIHAANPPLSTTLRNAILSAKIQTDDLTTFSSSSALDLDPSTQTELDNYRSSRRAIIHTLDRNHRHSRAAYSLVKDYRRAQYLPSIDFHTGTVQDYIEGRLADTEDKPFLSHAILDLPSAHDHAAPVIQALRPNGLLILFTPSISQIGDFAAWLREADLPLNQEKVLELPTTTVSEIAPEAVGGKPWDVKIFMPRNAQGESEGQPVQVMRPKVGDRVGGGGFVAVYRRRPANFDYKDAELLVVTGDGVGDTSGTAGVDASAADVGILDGVVDGVVEGVGGALGGASS